MLPTSPWHCPPTEFASSENKYEGVDTFAVVRNPYTRIISEYYFWLQTVRHKQVKESNNVENMNEWIIEALDNVTESGVCSLGHCIPSHKYIFRDGRQIVKHTLKMENLKEEFRDLMKQYDLPLELDDNNDKSDSSESILSVSDLSPDAISKINEWARLDFEYFDYKMLDPIHVVDLGSSLTSTNFPTQITKSTKKFAFATVLGKNPDEKQNQMYFDSIRVLRRCLKESSRSNADFGEQQSQ